MVQKIFHKLKKLKTFNQYNKILKDIALIFIPPLFTIMLNGRWIDALAAVFCGIVLVLMNKLFIFVQTNDFIKTLIVYEKIVAIYPFTQSIIGTEDVEYNSIIADVPANRVVAKVEDGEVINDDIYIKK